ncbi:erythromycin esterase family protein [Nonomuraea sp. SMC257]|uniref:Erythromycin esterase family protein n=1 Tax=Nonomuraea montanisoli TaxID=2741721 RepID=A0A7Y6M5F3_9ACTN|nr:erythromycin esterase family protein [Nonomuraea montanisoli]NUW34520.1 erythromycin esterase family protein [Nonomuraea montanisoli]
MVLPQLARDLADDARVVALGEGAHNITQFYELKDELFRLLVEEHGFTAFVMESGFAEGLAVNAWVHGGPGEVETVARDGITYRFGECEPMRRQLTWMREWNAANPAKVSFYGMDLPGSSTSPGPAVRACLDRLAALPGDEELRRLSDLGGRTEAAIRYRAMPAAERARLLDGLRDLVERAAEHDDGVVRRCGASIAAFLAELDLDETGPYPRDVFMAETVRWILEREERIVVSAHNAHVRRTPLHGRPMLGGLLGADAVVIGMTYGSGPEVRFTQRSPRPFDCEVSLHERILPPNAIESRLERLGPPVAAVDLRRAPAGLFDGVDGTLAAGGLDPVDDFPAAYDALVHVRRVTRVPGAFERLRAEFETGAQSPREPESP